MIDLPPHHLTTVQRILAEHLPDCEVRAFGSRVTGKARKHSDRLFRDDSSIQARF